MASQVDALRASGPHQHQVLWLRHDSAACQPVPPHCTMGAISKPAPHRSHRHDLITCACSYGYAPVVGVLVLLAAGAADGQTLRLGIAGDKYLKPYGIVILFMSQVMPYIARGRYPHLQDMAAEGLSGH